MSAHRTRHKLVRRGMAVGVYTAVLIALGTALLTGGSNGAAPMARDLSCPPHARPCTATVSRGTAHMKRRPPARHHVTSLPPVAPPITRERAFTLTITAGGPGSVDLCDGVSSCSLTYDAGAKVALTARPYAYGAFHRWDGCVAHGATCHVAMTRDRTVTADFQRTVTLTSTAGIDVHGRGACTAGCTFRRGARAQLRVTHDARATVKWTGVVCRGDTCTVRMTRDRTVKAVVTDPPRITQTWHAPPALAPAAGLK